MLISFSDEDKRSQMTSEEFPAEPRFEAMAALHSVVSNGEHVGKSQSS